MISQKEHAMQYSISMRRARGFSLIEIMVGVAIGLLGVLIIMQVSTVFEGQKRTTTTGADAQTNGVSALYTIERDVREAGYGFGPSAAGCVVKRTFAGSAIADFSLTPVVITNGASGAPDSIRVMAGDNGNWSLPYRLTVDHPVHATSLFLNTNLGVNAGDLLVAYQFPKTCTLIQVTDVPTDSKVQLNHEVNATWNAAGGAIYPAGGYEVGALIFDLGTLLDHTYSLANGNLTMSEYDSSTNTNTTRALISGIVNMQAEYGFDKRPIADVQNGPRVDTWSATMIDADDSGTTGDAGDINRIVAVRMAVVARSPLQEKPNAAGVCDITINTAVGSRLANAPTWAGGAIDVSKNPDGSTNPNWKCYRYKTFETVIPLRNLLWGRT